LLVIIYSHVASSTLDVTRNQLVSKFEQLMQIMCSCETSAEESSPQYVC